MPSISPIVINLPPGPPDHEWIKTLLSIAAGVALSLIAAWFIEPLKVRQQRKIDAQQGRDLIYEELAGLLDSCYFAMTMPRDSAKLLLERFALNHFGYYYDERREVFYSMKDYAGLWRLKRQIDLNTRAGEIGTYGAHHQIEQLINAFDYAQEVGDIDAKKLSAARAAQREELDKNREAFVRLLNKPSIADRLEY
jgi:hypothetical protein